MNDAKSTKNDRIPSASQPRLCESCVAAAQIDAMNGAHSQHFYWCPLSHLGLPEGGDLVGVIAVATNRYGAVASWQIVGPCSRSEGESLQSQYIEEAAAAGISITRATSN